jgi:hypothetical protein
MVVLPSNSSGKVKKYARVEVTIDDQVFKFVENVLGNLSSLNSPYHLGQKILQPFLPKLTFYHNCNKLKLILIKERRSKLEC